jgi:hypothetical protein
MALHGFKAERTRQRNFNFPKRRRHRTLDEFLKLLLEAVSKPQIAPKYKAWADEKTQHTWEYVSILRRPTTL